MKKTTIYVASKPDTFNNETSDISALMQRLNNCYIEKGLYFPLLTNDYIERAVGLGHEHGEKDKLLGDAAIALFLFGNEVDNETLGDLDEALELNRKSGVPKIAVYFKSPTDGQGESGDIKALKDRLTVEPDFYYYVYGHTDTLVLGLMMQIKQLKLPGMDIMLENGKVYQGLEALLSFEKAEIVSDYEELQRLKAERAELESGFYAAKSNHAENPDDVELFEQYCQAARLRNEANKKITDIEKQLYEIFDGMIGQTSKGALSRRQMECYRLIERGRLKEARQILDFDEILSETRRDKEIVEAAAKRTQINVNELLQLKDLNAALLDWEGVDACYREAVRLEEEYNLQRKAALDYLRHLLEQKTHNKAVELGARLKSQFETQGCGATDEQKSLLYHLLGVACWMTERSGEAEEACKAALAIRKARKDGDPDEIQEAIADTYNSLGIMYKSSVRFEEAHKSYNAALEIRKTVAGHDFEKYGIKLAYTYNNIGGLYNLEENFEKAVENLSAAREIFKELIKKKKDNSLETSLAMCYSNLGTAFKHMGSYDEAEQQFYETMGLLSRLAESNPEANESIIAWNHHCLGNLYTATKRYAEAEENFNTAIEMFGRYITHSATYEIDVADVLYDMGILFCDTKRYAEAESAVSSARSTYEKYKESNELYAGKVDEAQALLDRISSEQSSHLSRDMISAGLTQAEVNVARLLLNGESRSYITRYLHISAADYDMLEKSIRLKMNAVGSRDITIAAVAEKYKLTSREADMLRYLGRNAGNDVIAAELHLTDVTVRKHIRNLLTKLSIDERREVAGWLENFHE